MHNFSSFGPHLRALLLLGLPLVGSHLAQLAIHVTDTVMLGWYGVDALAAVVLGSTFIFVVFIAGSGFAQAVMPMVASALGAKDDVQARRVTRMAMWWSILFCCAVVPFMILSERLFLAMGQAPDLAHLAGQYVAIAGFGLFPSMLVNVFKSYLSAFERASIVLWVTVGLAVINGIANYALIFGNWGFPELGVQGAAIASVGAQAFSFIVLALYAHWIAPEQQLYVRFWRPDWDAFGRVFKIGLPIGLTSLAEVSMFASAAVMIGWIGKIDLAAHGIALQCASATFLVHLGLGNAATIRASRAMGAGDNQSLRDGAVAASMLSLVFAFASVVLFLSIPEQLIGLFLSPNDPVREAVIAAGVTLLVFAALFQVADSGQVIALSLLRGMHDTRVPMWFATMSYFLVGIPMGYVAGFVWGFGAPGVWTGLVIGLTVAWGLMGYRFWMVKMKHLPVTASAR